MGKRLQNIRERLRIRSWQAIIHIVIVQFIIQWIWDWISKMFTIPVVREIGFLVLFVVGLIVVAWYLPKLNPVFSGRSRPKETNPDEANRLAGQMSKATSTQEAVIREYSPQVKETLDTLIKHGEELTHQMQRDDFHRGQLGQEVRQWLDNTEHDVWEVVPEHASHLTSNEAVTKEPYTDQERLRYAGWNRNVAALRVSVDRRLVRLREIRSQILTVLPNWTAKIVDGAVIGLGFEFFPNRDVLARHHTLSERMASVNTVWALWPTGTHATGVIDAIQNGNIKRLILPHLEKSPIKELAMLTDNKPEDIVNDIKRTTRKALEKRAEQDKKQDILIQDRIEPRWYPGIVTNSIMIGNPEPLTDDSWLQVENLMPLKTEERTSYSLTFGKTPFQPLFKKVKSDFEQLWSKSLPIKETDL